MVGILGGSAGTTFDAFQMLWEAKKYGARVALYGRKINNAEHQLSFIEHLRAVADDQLPPDGGRQGLSRRPGAAGHPPAPLAGRRPGAHRDRLRLRRQAGRGEERPPASRTGRSAAPKRPEPAVPDFSKMTAGRKGAMEPGPLEADYRVSSGHCRAAPVLLQLGYEQRVQELLSTALRLPDKDRAELAASLIESLDQPFDADAQAAWAEEIERRISELDNGSVRAVPWEDARRIIAGPAE